MSRRGPRTGYRLGLETCECCDQSTKRAVRHRKPSDTCIRDIRLLDLAFHPNASSRGCEGVAWCEWKCLRSPGWDTWTHKDKRWRTSHPRVTLVQATSSQTVLVRSPSRLFGDSSDVLYTTYLRTGPADESLRFYIEVSAELCMLVLCRAAAPDRRRSSCRPRGLGLRGQQHAILPLVSRATRVALEGGASDRSASSQSQAPPHGAPQQTPLID